MRGGLVNMNFNAINKQHIDLIVKYLEIPHTHILTVSIYQ